MTQVLYTQASITLPELLSLNDDEFIHAAYVVLLGRSADKDGHSYYLGLLGTGTNRIEILRQIRSSPEGKRRHTKVLMLDRAIRLRKMLRVPLLGPLLRTLRGLGNGSVDGKKALARSVHSCAASIAQGDPQARGLSLFDESWYLGQHPDLDKLLAIPFNSFLRQGGFAGHWPSPFFHSDYYFNENPDVVASGLNPLIHYISYGESEGRRPNRLFDPSWYRHQYGNTAHIDGSPLAHFIVHGGFETNPSKYFDAIQYFRDCPDVRKKGINPLKHYFMSGMQEGRRALPTTIFEKANTSAIFELKNAFSKPNRAAIFITYTPDGLLRADVPLYLASLQRNGVSTILVVVSDQVRNYIPAEVVDHCAAIFVRQNAGFDFAAWAHAMQMAPEVLNANIVYLLNDSMVGPTSESEFSRLLSRIDELDADIVGLTANSYFCRHLQSYFLAIKKKALCSYWFNQYFLDVVNLDTKDAVIFQYEISFTARMKSHGFRCEALYGQVAEGSDQTISSWASLLRSGMPFVKRSLIIGEHAKKGGEAVLAALQSTGYPIELLTRRVPELTTNRPFAVVHLRKKGESFCEHSDSSQINCTNHPHLQNSRIKVTFLGAHNYSNGLAVAARGYISSLHHTNLRVNIHQIEKPFHIHSRVGFDCNVRVHCGPSDVVIVHVNPDDWRDVMSQHDCALIDTARRRVGMFAWELSTLPAQWIRGLNEMDAIIAPSEFCANLFRRYVNIPVFVAPYPVPVSALNLETGRGGSRRPLREKYSIPMDKRLILYVFDGSKILARENPIALIKAFRESGLGKTGWQLVLKTKYLFDVVKTGNALISSIADDKSISLIDASLPTDEMRQLFDDAEIYASPHCSVGFGLAIAEAMARGKIVVATDFSGSKDYLDTTCGFPVPVSFVTLDGSYGPHRAGDGWVVIDQAALAKALQKAAEETDRRHLPSDVSVATRAVNRIREKLSYEAVAKKLENIVSIVHSGPQYSDRTSRFGR